MKPALLLSFVLAFALHSNAAAQTEPAKPPMGGPSPFLCTPNEITWKDGPPSLPAGAKFAVLEGDPTKDGFFLMRIWLPDGYKIPPHIHPKVERVTVVSGIFNLGTGDTFNQSATEPMPAGTYGYWPPGMKHFAWAQGETVVQIHGVGPWKIEYLNPADDPRNAKTSATR